MAGRRKETAFKSLLDDVETANENYVVILFLDLKSAFENVSRALLLQKL